MHRVIWDIQIKEVDFISKILQWNYKDYHIVYFVYVIKTAGWYKIGCVMTISCERRSIIFILFNRKYKRLQIWWERAVVMWCSILYIYIYILRDLTARPYNLISHVLFRSSDAFARLVNSIPIYVDKYAFI